MYMGKGRKLHSRHFWWWLKKPYSCDKLKNSVWIYLLFLLQKMLLRLHYRRQQAVRQIQQRTKTLVKKKLWFSLKRWRVWHLSEKHNSPCSKRFLTEFHFHIYLKNKICFGAKRFYLNFKRIRARVSHPRFLMGSCHLPNTVLQNYIIIVGFPVMKLCFLTSSAKRSFFFCQP